MNKFISLAVNYSFLSLIQITLAIAQIFGKFNKFIYNHLMNKSIKVNFARRKYLKS
jgi:hypothetical protein